MSTLRRGPDFYGWRVVAAAFVVAVFGWGVGFYGPPVYLEAVRQARGRTPAAMGQVPDGRPAHATGPAAKGSAALPVVRRARDRAFVTLSLGMALALFAQIGLIAQLVSVLVPALGTQVAGLAAGLSTAAAIVGRLLVGWGMPPGADRRRVAALSLLVQATGCGALMLSGGMSTPLLLLGVVLIGLGIGNATSLPPLIAQVEFARADALRVVALIVTVSQAAYAFAPATFGLLRQLGSDGLVFALAAGIQGAAIGAYLSGTGAHAAREGGSGPAHGPCGPARS